MKNTRRSLRRLAFTLSQTPASQGESIMCTHKNNNNSKILTVSPSSALTCLSDDYMVALMPLQFHPFNEIADRRQFLELIGEQQHAFNPLKTVGASVLPENCLEEVIIIEDQHRKRLCATTTLQIEPKFTHETAYVGHVMDVAIAEFYREYGVAAPLLKRLKDIARQKKMLQASLRLHIWPGSFVPRSRFRSQGSHDEYRA